MGIFGHSGHRKPAKSSVGYYDPTTYKCRSRSRSPSKERSRSPDGKTVAISPAVEVVSESEPGSVKLEVGEREPESDAELAQRLQLEEMRKAEEKVPVKLGPTEDEDDETVANTKANAMLYHFTDESVDMYRRENTSSDLLGRLYYDDYDSDTPGALSGTATPLLSPTPTGGNMSDSSSSRPESRPESRSTTPRPGLPRLYSLERGVSFDTSDNDARRSVIFKVKHPQFKFRRNNKTFLAGFNHSAESLRAIEWLFDEMVVHGDTIVVLEVLEERRYQGVDRAAAQKALATIEGLNRIHKKKVKLIFETVVGKPQRLLKTAINEYNPQMMVMGTKHYDRKISKPLFAKESFSKHFLECALVPVILVKPTYHYVEDLQHPVDGPDYFEHWLRDIDVSGSYEKKRKKGVFSPTVSRGNSYTNLAQLTPDRGRPAAARGNSSQNLAAMVTERMAERGRSPQPPGLAARTPERGRSPAPPPVAANVRPSRSRSRSRQRLSKMFGIGE
ncbi:hypothetical protein DICA0_B05446 [Diutina catenulata]